MTMQYNFLGGVQELRLQYKQYTTYNIIYNDQQQSSKYMVMIIYKHCNAQLFLKKQIRKTGWEEGFVKFLFQNRNHLPSTKYKALCKYGRRRF